MLIPISKERNKKRIIIYYILALIFAIVGMFTNRSMWYIVAVAFLILALVRKYWLMGKLK